MRDHKKLRAFQLADELTVEIYRATVEFPRTEQFGLTSQMRRAAVSIACNIVEGSARISKAEYVRFLEIAYGSARELEYLISLTNQLEILTRSSFDTLNERAIETAKVLHGLIRSLTK